MIKQIVNSVIILLILIFTAGCISFTFGPKSIKRSTSVEFTPPPVPFTSIKESVGDQTWRNSKNGNTISYLSDCESENDPSLEMVLKEALSGLENIELIDRKELNFDTRLSLRNKLIGQVDGVKMSVDIIAYKKNNCIYTLTYVGLPKHIESDQKIFESFISSFRAP